MHIGLIGGIGPAATDYYYRGLIDRYARAGKPLELTIAHADLRDLAQNRERGDKREQAVIFAQLVRRLAAADAKVVAVTSIGGHFCIAELEALSPLPIINAIPEIDAVVRQRNLKTVGILGTRAVMETGLYGGISSAQLVLPKGEALELVDKTYLEMAIAGRVNDAQRRVFFSIGENLCRLQGADAVILGGTDLFLAFKEQDCHFPLIDCAAVHVDAIYQMSLRES
jgi:aspartate racemase